MSALLEQQDARDKLHQKEAKAAEDKALTEALKKVTNIWEQFTKAI